MIEKGETMNKDDVQPDDLRLTARICMAALAPDADGDWSICPPDLEWTAQETLDHMVRALTSYANHFANRATERIPLPKISEAAIGSLGGAAGVLAEVIRAAGPEARGRHVLGMADRSGFAAMGCDEMLIHTHDIAGAFGRDFTPPDDLCRRILCRLFPWAPQDVAPWPGLLWANGRVALPGHPRLDQGWIWHCRPLAEWDGTIPPGVQ
jgi:hypothetical protein